MQEWNNQIIEEFRANGGQVGGQFEGAPLLILHTIGARTGQQRQSPLMYRREGEAIAVFASKAGAPDNPDWYHNIRANPEVTVEIGAETRTLRARVADAAERDGIWERQKAEWPQFAGYEEATDRAIPVVVLEAG